MSGNRARKAIILFTNWDTITGKPAILTAQDVTFENLDTNGDVGSGAGQVAQGTHGHSKSEVGLGNADNTSDANKPVSTAQQTALDLKANLASPALTGNPTAPTQIPGDDSAKIATTAFIQAAITALIGAAPATLDTLAEIASAINDDENLYTTLTGLIGEKLAKASNLSDLNDASAARTNLGLGSVALLASISISDVTGLQTALNAKLESISKAMVEAVLTGTISSHNHSGTYEPADSTILKEADFGTGSGKVTEGDDSRLSDNRAPGDDSVTIDKLDDQFKEIVAMAALNVDWSAGQVFTKTLTGNSTITFSNIHIGVKDLEITGDYTLGLPTGFKIVSGEYDGSVMNFIQVVCTNKATPKGWVVISQEAA